MLDRPKENHKCLLEHHTVNAGSLAFRLDIDGLRNFSLYCCAEHIFRFLEEFGSNPPTRFASFTVAEDKKMVYTADRRGKDEYPCVACEEDISKGDDCYTFHTYESEAPPAGIHTDCTSAIRGTLDDAKDAAAEYPDELLPELL